MMLQYFGRFLKLIIEMAVMIQFCRIDFVIAFIKYVSHFYYYLLLFLLFLFIADFFATLIIGGTKELMVLL